VINPSLLYVNAAGYGVDGPYANRALYAQAAQAVGGSFGRQVGHWSNAEQVAGASLDELQALVFPRVRQVIDGDSNAALCVLALLSLGLFEQRRSGLGQRLDTSMIAANAWAYGDDFCTYVNKPPAVTCDSEAFGVSALERLYPAADGTWLCLAVRTAEERRALATALGDPHLQNEKSEDALVATLTALFAKRSALDWEEALSAVKVGAAAVSLQGQAAFSSFDPGLRAAGLTVAVEHPLFGEMVRWAPHIAFSESNGRVAPPCVRGEHNHAVLRELGYGSAAISALEAKGVVFPPTDPNQVARI
jgi:crotonobetainyl-CoA:carnitine CoA-transferase CaiB-like acyl-CoA transferase